MDQPEKKIQVHKKSFWRFPADAKVALGMKTGNDTFFEASQFVVVNGSGLEIRLEDSNLEIWVNSKKEIGLAKHYPIGKSGKGKYLSKVVAGGKVILAVTGVVANFTM